MFSRVKISKYVNQSYKIIKKPIAFKTYRSNLRNFWKSNDEKLLNNIIRAKTTIFDYIMNNDFKFFVTITVNPKYNRNNLEWLRRTTSQIIRNLRVKYGGEFKYILIPEQHKDGCWHMHGLFDKDFGQDFYYNDNGYLSWSSYDHIGFSSISKIRDYVACGYYITKYVRKDFEKREKGKHLYFCSKNLIKSNFILDLVCTNDDLDWDFENEYCSKLECDKNKFESVFECLKKDIYSVLEDKECLL